MIHPEYRVQGDLSTPELQETLTPVYPTTEGIKQATLRKLTDQALELLDTCAITELLPPELAQGMMSLPEALRTLHRPPPRCSSASWKAANIRRSSVLFWKSCWRIT
jgi:ATP-dependent DNA helicase RecG